MLRRGVSTGGGLLNPPGVTLIELFAFLGDNLLFRLDQDQPTITTPSTKTRSQGI